MNNDSFIHHNSSTSLYSPSCRLWEKIRAANSKVITVYFESDCNDFQKKWASELENNIYFEQLQKQFLEVRSLLTKLNEADVVLVSIFEGGALDSYFDFGLACNHSFIKNENSFFGFPQTSVNCLPALARFYSPEAKEYFDNHPWRKKPVLTGKHVVKSHIMEDWTDTPSHPIDLEELIEGLSATKKSRKKTLFQQSFTPGVGPDQNKKSQVWAYKKRILAHKNFSNTPEIENMASLVSSKQYLDKGYMTQISEGALHHRYSSMPLKSPLPKQLYIDIRSRLPDLQTIFKILEKNSVHIIFVHDDSKLLGEYLNIIYSRLENMANVPEHLENWHQRINWITAKPENFYHSYRISYRQNKWITLAIEDLKLNFFIASNELSVIEIHQDPSLANDSAKDALKYLFGTPICLPPLPIQLPYSYLIRSVFFEKMLDYCKQHKISLDQLAGVFKKDKWSFAGNLYQWKMFLNSRFMFYSDFLDHTSIDGLNADYWAVQSWYRAQYIVKSKFSILQTNVDYFKVLNDFKGIVFDVYDGLLVKVGPQYAQEINILIKASLGINEVKESPISMLLNDHPRYLETSIEKKDLYEKLF